ncbi:MAG: hydrogenase subunit MbhD domain-containing protein [Acidimicrobiales bacterium]
MIPLVVAALALVALGGTVTVFTMDPARQAVTLSAFGVTLAVLFVLLAAPDVALSQIGVESAIVPLIVMLAVAKIRSDR